MSIDPKYDHEMEFWAGAKRGNELVAKQNRPLCIYHGNCADGFASAWIVENYFHGQVDFHAGVYQKEPPDVAGRDVIIADFSYKRAVIESMLTVAKSITILDHHKSAIEDLKGLAGKPENIHLTTIFDMHRSGAMITWDHYFSGAKPPKLLEHIQDRDLWQFKLGGTREIQAAVFSYDYDFLQWDYLMSLPVDVLAAEGAALERKHFKDIKELLSVGQQRMLIAGHDVPVANLPYTLSSDAGHIMAKGEKFAACYMDVPDGRNFSLRSAEDGMDVSEIAKQFGGGGHKHAAGFTVPCSHPLAGFSHMIHKGEIQ